MRERMKFKSKKEKEESIQCVFDIRQLACNYNGKGLGIVAIADPNSKLLVSLRNGSSRDVTEKFSCSLQIPMLHWRLFCQTMKKVIKDEFAALIIQFNETLCFHFPLLRFLCHDKERNETMGLVLWQRSNFVRYQYSSCNLYRRRFTGDSSNASIIDSSFYIPKREYFIKNTMGTLAHDGPPGTSMRLAYTLGPSAVYFVLAFWLVLLCLVYGCCVLSHEWVLELVLRFGAS